MELVKMPRLITLGSGQQESHTRMGRKKESSESAHTGVALSKISGGGKFLFRCDTSRTIVSGKAVAAAVGVGVGILAAAAITMPSSSNGKEDTGSDDWGEEKTLKQGFKPRLVPDDLEIIVIGSGTGHCPIRITV
jgi:hypothetical protein